MCERGEGEVKGKKLSWVQREERDEKVCERGAHPDSVTMKPGLFRGHGPRYSLSQPLPASHFLSNRYTKATGKCVWTAYSPLHTTAQPQAASAHTL